MPDGNKGDQQNDKCGVTTGGIILDSNDDSGQLVVKAEAKTQAGRGMGDDEIIIVMRVEPGDDNAHDESRDSRYEGDGPIIVR